MDHPPAPTEPLDAFERTVIDRLLTGDHVALAHLRAQVRIATVRNRERNQYGQFTDLWVPDVVSPLEVADRFALDDLYGRIDGCEEEAAFLLHVVRGRVKTLEAFVPRPQWPEHPTLREHWYVAPDPDPEAAGQLVRVAERDLGFALRGLTELDGEE